MNTNFENILTELKESDTQNIFGVSLKPGTYTINFLSAIRDYVAEKYGYSAENLRFTFDAYDCDGDDDCVFILFNGE